LPYAGADENGNDIYMNPNGSLTYADGSPATRADIAYNCGACSCTPCSPTTSGETDPSPRGGSRGGGGSPGAPQGGGSGGGTAKPLGGQSNPKCTQVSKLSQTVSKLGATMASLLTGGQKTTATKVLPGQKVGTVAPSAISSNSFLLIIVIVGGLLLFMAFGHKAEGA
jgi:hypothetical protein